MYILDVEDSNSPDNLSLLVLYEGKDSADNLRLFCTDVFLQLIDLNGKEYSFQRQDGSFQNVKLTL